MLADADEDRGGTNLVTIPPVISLGTNCEITFNLRRFFGIERAYPFDWWITPLDIIAATLGNHLEVGIADDNLEVSDDRMTIVNTKYGILHHHDFPRDSDGLIVPNWRSLIPGVRTKYKYLGDRLFSDLDNSGSLIFFINRNGTHRWLSDERSHACQSPKPYADIAGVIQSLFPRLHFSLMVINSTTTEISTYEQSAMFQFMTTTDYGDRFEGDPNHFAGSLKGWDEVLSKVVLPQFYR